jgi:hypothetical protein
MLHLLLNTILMKQENYPLQNSISFLGVMELSLYICIFTN